MKVIIGISQSFLMGWLRIYLALQGVILPTAHIMRSMIKIYMAYSSSILKLINRERALRSRFIKITDIFVLDIGRIIRTITSWYCGCDLAFVL